MAGTEGGCCRGDASSPAGGQQHIERLLGLALARLGEVIPRNRAQERLQARMLAGLGTVEGLPADPGADLRVLTNGAHRQALLEFFVAIGCMVLVDDDGVNISGRQSTFSTQRRFGESLQWTFAKAALLFFERFLGTDTLLGWLPDRETEMWFFHKTGQASESQRVRVNVVSCDVAGVDVEETLDRLGRAQLRGAHVCFFRSELYRSRRPFGGPGYLGPYKTAYWRTASGNRLLVAPYIQWELKDFLLLHGTRPTNDPEALSLLPEGRGGWRGHERD